MKKLLSEEKVRQEFSNILLEDKASQQEIVDIVKKSIKNGDIDKELSDAIKKEMKNGNLSHDMEKKVKDLVATCINNLFKTLWFRHSFYEDEIKR